MNSFYLTVAGNAQEEMVIQKSRFIGFASHCTEEEEALRFLQSVREEHKTATHHCYAYIIGENRGIMRYSDDGEPGGTAGLPIMDVLKNKAVVDCCIVVVRYFGGVLLGTGGLVRAYTQSAQAAVTAAGIVRMEESVLFRNELPYSSWDRFRYTAEKLPVQIDRIEYGSAVCFRMRIRSKDQEEVLSRLMEASDRKLVSEAEAVCWEPWTET